MTGVRPVAGSIEKDDFENGFDNWSRTIRNTKPSSDTRGSLIPGDLDEKRKR